MSEDSSEKKDTEPLKIIIPPLDFTSSFGVNVPSGKPQPQNDEVRNSETALYTTTVEQMLNVSEPLDVCLKRMSSEGVQTFALGEVHSSQFDTNLEIEVIKTLVEQGKKVKIAIELDQDKQDQVSELVEKAKKGTDCTSTDIRESNFYQIINLAAKINADVICVDDHRQQGRDRDQQMNRRVKFIHQKLETDEMLVFVVGSGHLSSHKGAVTSNFPDYLNVTKGVKRFLIVDSHKQIPLSVADIGINPQIGELRLSRYTNEVSHFSNFNAVLLG